MEPTDRSKYDPRIDVGRASAFLLVAAAHFPWPVESLPDRGLVVDTIALGLIRTGWLGVPLFLFISGYSLGLGKTHATYALDIKQFYLNRVLRLYPIWVVCILAMMADQTLKLSGTTVISLLLMQMQDIPAGGAFSLAWTLQLEFICYLLFPFLLAAVATNRFMVALYFALFFAFRINRWFANPSDLWSVSYNTVFGEGTIFLTGILASSLAPVTSKAQARLMFWGGITVFCAIAVFVYRHGGYQEPRGHALRLFFLVMPECLAATFFIMMRGWLARVPNLDHDSPLSRGRRAVFSAFTHLGKVSYSAYMFSLYCYWFWHWTLHMPKSGYWHVYILSFVTYIGCVWMFATITYNAIELPFLRKRRIYAMQRETTSSRS